MLMRGDETDGGWGGLGCWEQGSDAGCWLVQQGESWSSRRLSSTDWISSCCRVLCVLNAVTVSAARGRHRGVHCTNSSWLLKSIQSYTNTHEMSIAMWRCIVKDEEECGCWCCCHVISVWHQWCCHHIDQVELITAAHLASWLSSHLPSASQHRWVFCLYLCILVWPVTLVLTPVVNWSEISTSYICHWQVQHDLRDVSS